MTTGEVGHTSALPQYLSGRFGWKSLVRVVSAIYAGLLEADRSRAIVLGRNYGHSGTLEYRAKRYELPPVYGGHNDYWLWGPPRANRDTVVIAVGRDAESLQAYFEKVVAAGAAESDWALESRITVLLCRGLERPIEDVWPEVKIFV